MKNAKHKVTETANFLKAQIETLPEIGLLTGTGLGDSVKGLKASATFEYKDIPHFPLSTVESHFGIMLMGSMQGKQVIVMQGRFHLYEGYSPLEVTFPIRVMQELGVKYLVVMNAAGGLNTDFRTGDIMCISDHINLTGENPLIGQNEERWGIRFPDMTVAYDRSLAMLAQKAVENTEIRLVKGVYAGLKGPSLETPAEVRYLKIIGADAVGFSTIQEVIAAIHAGMKVLGLSTITNIVDPDAPTPATVEEIIEVAKDVAPKIETVIKHVVKQI